MYPWDNAMKIALYLHGLLKNTQTQLNHKRNTRQIAVGELSTKWHVLLKIVKVIKTRKVWAVVKARSSLRIYDTCNAMSRIESWNRRKTLQISVCVEVGSGENGDWLLMGTQFVWGWLKCSHIRLLWSLHSSVNIHKAT